MYMRPRSLTFTDFHQRTDYWISSNSSHARRLNRVSQAFIAIGLGASILQGVAINTVLRVALSVIW